MQLRKTQLVRLSLLIFFCVVFLRPASSHDPITTTVTFNKEVVRILQRNCWGCHAPGKIKSDISLTTFEQARPWAKAIKEEILEKRMPPFQAVKGFGDFHNGYLLAKRDVELVVSWVEGGAPRGEEKDYPANTFSGTGWTLGKPDLNLQPDEIINIPAGEGDEIRCIKLPTKLTQQQWLQGLEFIPTNASIIHSAEFFIAGNCNAKCADGEKIGEWNPGEAAIKLPADVGFSLPANACITMKIRYRKSAAAAQDHSVLGVYLANDQITKQARQQMLKAPITLIPAGTNRQRVKATLTVRENTEALAIRPLLFPYVKSFEAVVTRPDGTTEVLILAQNYRANWQPSYYFKTPVKLPAGTRIEAIGYLDNSDDNQNLGESIKAVRFAENLCELVLTKPLHPNSNERASR